jgi:hypothetical protein
MTEATGTTETAAAEAVALPTAASEEATPPAPPETPEQAAEREKTEARQGRIDRATRAERAATEAREMRRAKAEREKASAERQRLATERQQWEARQQQEAEAIRRGGLGALKARTGLEYSQLTKEWIDQSTPEGKERARIAEMLDKQQQTIQQLTQQQQRAAIDQAFTGLQATLEANAEKYPHAYDMSSRMFRAAVPAVAQALINQGRQPTESLVLKMLDDAEKTEHDERESRRSARLKRIATKPSNGATSQANRSTATGAVRTLTAQDVSERAAGRGTKTDAELDEEIARTIRPMLKMEE